jgi:DNA-binding FadR family transcriptional regulator
MVASVLSSAPDRDTGETVSKRKNQKGTSLVDSTARQIGMAIVSGEFGTKKPLPIEAEIMKRYRVSRNVVREAVKTLVGKGLLRTVRRAGTFVEPKQAWNLLDADVLAWTMTSPPLRASLLGQLTQLRFMIEPEVAALAATHATTTEILRISEAYEAMEHNRFDAEKAVNADIDFHQRLFDAAHNDLIRSLLPAFVTLLRSNFELTIHSANGYIRNLEEHRLIAEAVRSRDPDQARRAMHNLLHNNQEDISKMLSGDDPIPL